MDRPRRVFRLTALLLAALWLMTAGCGGGGGTAQGAGDDYGGNPAPSAARMKAFGALKFIGGELASTGIGGFAGVGMGFLLDSIFGDAGQNAVLDKLDEISRKLDQIVAQLNQMQAQLDQLLMAVGAARDDIIAGQQAQAIKPAFDRIRADYNELLLATHPNTLYTPAQIDDLVDTILSTAKHDIPAQLDSLHSAIVGATTGNRGFLDAWTDVMINRVAAGEGLLACYNTIEQYFAELLTVQAQGLLLVAEAKNVGALTLGTPDNYENDDIISNAKDITLNQAQWHSFHVADDPDYVKFTLTATTTITIPFQTGYWGIWLYRLDGTTWTRLVNGQRSQVTMTLDPGQYSARVKANAVVRRYPFLILTGAASRVAKDLVAEPSAPRGSRWSGDANTFRTRVFMPHIAQQLDVFLRCVDRLVLQSGDPNHAGFLPSDTTDVSTIYTYVDLLAAVVSGVYGPNTGYRQYSYGLHAHIFLGPTKFDREIPGATGQLSATVFYSGPPTTGSTPTPLFPRLQPRSNQRADTRRTQVAKYVEMLDTSSASSRDADGWAEHSRAGLDIDDGPTERPWDVAVVTECVHVVYEKADIAWPDNNTSYTVWTKWPAATYLPNNTGTAPMARYTDEPDPFLNPRAKRQAAPTYIYGSTVIDCRWYLPPYWAKHGSDTFGNASCNISWTTGYNNIGKGKINGNYDGTSTSDTAHIELRYRIRYVGPRATVSGAPSWADNAVRIKFNWDLSWKADTFADTRWWCEFRWLTLLLSSDDKFKSESGRETSNGSDSGSGSTTMYVRQGFETWFKPKLKLQPGQSGNERDYSFEMKTSNVRLEAL